MELDVMEFTRLSIEGSTSGDWGKDSRFCKVIWREFDPVHLRKWTGLLQLLAELDPCPSWLVKTAWEVSCRCVQMMVIDVGESVQCSGPGTRLRPVEHEFKSYHKASHSFSALRRKQLKPLCPKTTRTCLAVAQSKKLFQRHTKKFFLGSVCLIR